MKAIVTARIPQEAELEQDFLKSLVQKLKIARVARKIADQRLALVHAEIRDLVDQIVFLPDYVEEDDDAKVLQKIIYDELCFRAEVYHENSDDEFALHDLSAFIKTFRSVSAKASRTAINQAKVEAQEIAQEMAGVEHAK